MLPVSGPPLLERQHLLDQLSGHLDAARRGAGSLVAIGGEAGAGKTALVAAFMTSCPPDLTVRHGACDAITTPRPLGALRDVVVPGSPLDTAMSAGRPPGDVFALVLDELRTAPRPTLLVVEDVHWADEATLDLLRYLTRRVADVPALVLVTYRDDESGPEHPLRIMLGDLAATRTLHRLFVPRLSSDAVTHLAAGAGLDGAALYRTTGGNPFFVSEVIASAPREIPDTVRDAVLARRSRLPVEAQDLLDATSVVASRVPRWLLSELVGVDLPGLDVCLASGVLVDDEVESDGGIRFRHELARLAVESALPLARRTTLHRRMVDVLRAKPPTLDPAWIVHHAIGGGDDGVVREYGLVAAERAAALGAHREAVAHLDAVLARSEGVGPSERAQLLDRRSYECYLTGDFAAAAATREESLAQWRVVGDPIRIGDALRWMSRLYWFLARRTDADTAGADAVAILENQPHGRELALAYSNQSQLAMLSGDSAAAVSWGERAIVLADDIGDVEIKAHALNNMGTARALSGDVGGVSDLEQSLAISLEHGLEEHVARAYTNLLCRAIWNGDVGAAQRYASAGATYCLDRDLDAWWIYMAGWRAFLALQLDDWTSAVSTANEVLTAGRASPMSRILPLVVLAVIRARRGDPEVDPLLDEAERAATSAQEFERLGHVAFGRAEVSWLSGSTAAPDDLVRVLHGFRERRDPFLAALLLPWARRFDISADVMDVLEARIVPGMQLPVSGYDRAIASVDGDQVDDLRRAAETLRQLGAGPALNRVSARLRELGEAGVRPARPSTAANPAGLTEREVDVARLVADGLTNAQIAQRLVLSERTVGHHVSAVLRKLGVRRRGDVAAAVARHND